MNHEVQVPSLPESIRDATILAWHCQPGDRVQAGDKLVDLETDKVVLEVPASLQGTVVAIHCPVGATVTAGTCLATLTSSSESLSSHPPPVASVAKPQTPPAASAVEAVLAPAARRLVKELDLDPGQIPGSGRHGRILKSDIMTYLDSTEKSQPEQHPETLAAASLEEPATQTPGRPEQRVRMTRLRARIAERLVAAQQTAAILTTFNEVNLKAVNELRERHREAFEKRHQVRLGLMSFFVRAVVEALQRFPIVNAALDGDEIVYHGYYDIGIAVSSPRGLVVPILRDAGQKSFAEVERAIVQFGEKAQKGTLSLEELTGGTFTLTNGGVFGSLLSTPILNPPQSAILGMHTLQQRPVVENGEIVIRPMMYLALSYDHRIIDGRDAVQCLVAIKQMLEDPARLLLQL
ncbi:MAG: 2-oxoglutarate dehydrogenase complex dihydrolipoyllysine-residue succinyltransferase [Pseudomonadota bacterium]